MEIIKGTKKSLIISDKNRNINEPHVSSLIKSMKEFGFLYSKPIQVDSDLIIIDGHHRYDAANTLGIPFYYIIEPVKNIHTMLAAIDKGTRKWMLLDWINYWANAGKQNYIEILDYINDGFSPSVMVTMASNTNYRDKVMNGEFEITNKNFYYMISQIIKIIKIIPFVKFKTECGALVIICQNIENFDFEKLNHKCKTFPTLWKRSTNLIDAIKQIENLYNYRAHQKISFGKLYL